MRQMIIILFTLLYICQNVECAKILCIFSAPCISHQAVFRRFSEELHRKGHDLVIITPLPKYSGQTVKNLTEINIYDVSYGVWKNFTDKLSSNTKQDLNQQNKEMIVLVTEMIFSQITDKGVQDLINNKNNKFDLVLAESGNKMLLIISHIFKAPTIFISSQGAYIDNFEVFGATIHPLLYPPLLSRRFYKLSFWEKYIAMYDYYWLKYVIINQQSIENELLKKHFGIKTPTVNELSNKLDCLFLNIHRTWEGNRPVPLNVLYFGGMHQMPEKELPQDLKSYLDLSKNGIIYMSFGTNVAPSLFAPEKLQIFINVFSKLPYDIIWKWDGEDIPGRSDNVKVMKWTPQADLLRHPKIKLFITQGGAQSTDESITAGVPFIGIPILGDQWYTTEKYVQHKIGIKLDLNTLTEEQFKESIETVIGDKSYRKNVVKLRNVLYDQPQTSLERAVWWTEYVLRHGGAKHLRGPAANISWAEYMELNLMLTLLITLFIIISLLMFFTYLFFRSMRKLVVSILKKIKFSN